MISGSPGRLRNHQKSKKGLPKIDRKKRRKKGADPPRFRSSAAALAQPRESKDSVQEGACQVQRTSLKHASTPGGVRRIADRLREDRRTPLHSWRSHMCGESIRILAVSASILSESWRFLVESLPQNAIAFANFIAKTFCKNHSKMPSQTIKIHQNGPKWRPSKTISLQGRKRAKKKGQSAKTF